MALAASHQRSEQQAFAALVVRHYQIHYLLVGVAHHLLAAYGRVCGGGAGVEETQEVGDFSNGSDGGPGVVAGGFLFYGDDGAEALYAFYLGLVEDPHKVLGVGREGVQIAALAFGVDGVECQGALAAAADARNYRKRAARDIHVHVLQVMGIGATYLYILPFVHRIR